MKYIFSCMFFVLMLLVGTTGVYAQFMDYPDELLLSDAYEGLARMYGVNPGDHTGSSIDIADINGDGYGDVIIGTNQGNAIITRPKSGVVYVYFGAPEFFGTNEYLPMENPASMQLVFGSDLYEHSGYKINHGDFNADGIDDLMIGAIGEGYSPGKLHILMGAETLQEHRIIDLSADQAMVVTIQGRSPSSNLGFACDSGDFNGDGVDDILVGAPYGGPSLGFDVPGEAFIIPGSTVFFESGDIDLYNKPENVLAINGENYGDAFGIGITAGDLNGDGYDDAIIGAWTSARFPGIPNVGRIYVYWGSPESIDRDTITAGTPTSNWMQIVGESGMLGHNIFTGDLDNDGVTDLIAGAHTYGYGQQDNWTEPPEQSEEQGYWIYSGQYIGQNDLRYRYECGALYCIYGDSALHGRTHIDLADTDYNVLKVVGAESGDHCAIGIVADVNTDGIPDLIAAAPEARYMDYYVLGTAHIIWGPFVNEAETIDLATSSRSFSKVFSEYDGGGFCRNNIETGDVNGDGLNDLVLPCILGDPLMQNDAGLVYVLSGDQSDYTFIPKQPVHVAEDTPVSITLQQNFPNPFNPATTIPFTLSDSGTVRLSIFNILGERIDIIADGIYSAGSHEIVWDASGVSSGVYFCRLEAAGTIQTQRMLLVR